MADQRLLGPADVRRRLAELAHKELNFDPADLGALMPGAGWLVDDLCQPLPAEPPGQPTSGGSWETARRLMAGYEFADPSIVRAFYDTDEPLEERNMLLKLQVRGLVHLFVGVRVAAVYDETREVSGSPVRVWGWSYRTLEGHVEAGQMDWEVWKWVHSGEVQFRVHAVSHPARIANPFVHVGFLLLRGHERRVFLQSTKRRMRELTELGLQRDQSAEALRSAAERATARPGGDMAAVHEKLAGNLRAGDDAA